MSSTSAAVLIPPEASDPLPLSPAFLTARASPFGIAAMLNPVDILKKSTSASQLGSICPIIIKHDFPNEFQHYIDNTYTSISSTQKRFRYDRPNNSVLSQNQNSLKSKSGWNSQKG